MRSNQVTAESKNKGEVITKIFLDLNSPDAVIKRPLSSLKEDEFIQIRIPIVPEGSQVIGGNVVCVFNGNTRVQIPIPPQQMVKDLIFVHKLQDVISVSQP
jgi:hypothetical protein